MSVGDAAVWKPVEEAKWSPVPSLGPEWMSKWSVSKEGYWVMLTDGCGLWGETRADTFILDKAEDWAPCIEAEVQKLSLLVLSELGKLSVRAKWREQRQDVVLHVTSRLNDLSYKWEFELTRLSDSLFRQHWVMPLIVQVHSLGAKVKQLSTEVEHKRKLLDELQPDKTKTPNKSPKKKDVGVEKSVEAVAMGGAWTVLQDHLLSYPSIMKHFAALRNDIDKKEAEEAGNRKEAPQPASTNAVKRQTQQEEEEAAAEREKLQRAKIQQIQQGPVKPATQTKKKKLKI